MCWQSSSSISNSFGSCLSHVSERQLPIAFYIATYGISKSSRNPSLFCSGTLIALTSGYPVSYKEIGRAFRKASLKLHPDKLVACGVEETSAAEEAFAAVREAYDTLSDPVTRDRYDKRASRVCPCFFGDLFLFCF